MENDLFNYLRIFDTCTPGEESGIKRIQTVAREQGTAPPTVGAMRRIGLFGEPTRSVQLSQLTKLLRAKVAAGSRHAWWLKFGRIDRLEGAPTVGALGDIGRVSRNQSDFGCPRAGRHR